MNERIIELAEQAGGHYSREEFEFAVVFSELEDFEKFAKLIVKECMDVVDPGVNQVIARYQARQWLAEHFGVE